MNFNILGYKISLNKIRANYYGWCPDVPDHRDFRLEPPVDASMLPPFVDLTPQCPKVYNQGALGSCTSQAIAAAIQFDQDKQNKLHDFMPSRLFIYWNEREMEGATGEDSGAQIRDGIKSVNVQGVCPESVWPYSTWRCFIAPSKAARKAALLHRSLMYQRIDNTNLANIKSCLASGYPIVFGFTVYTAFESPEVAATGILNMPQPNESVLGGHCVLAVGYNDAMQRLKVRNSWGLWGNGGYFSMPYDYISNTDLACDFWTIKSVTDN